jgi:hypothetical protein
VNVLALHAASLVVGIALLVGILFIVLLVVAPWKSVRAEPALDEDIETRLLLGEDPELIAADEDAAETAWAPIRDLDDPGDEFRSEDASGYDQLARLDELADDK